MSQAGSSVAQPLNRTLDGTNASAAKNKAVYLLHSNLKIFVNAIAALSKLGDEIFIQTQERGLRLKTFNKNRSAYGVFLFIDDFFSDFDTKFVKCGVRDCRISTKTALTIFKSAHFIEKNLISCKLTVDCLGEDLRIDFQHTYDISRSFDVNVMEIHKPFTTNVNRSDLLNAVTVNALDIAPFLNEMHTGREELVMRTLEDKIIFKNYVPCEVDTIEGFGCRTEITVQKACFKHYAIKKQSEVSFSLKEFKSIITFARQHSCDVSLFYDRPGSPLIVAVESDAGYSAEFIIATLDGDDHSDEDAEATQEPVDSAKLRAQYSKGLVSGTPGRTSLRRRVKRTAQGFRSQPLPVQPDFTDEETETAEQHVEPQRNTEEEEEEMGPTQPSRNPLLADSLMGTADQNLDLPLADENVDQNSTMEQPIGDHMITMDDFNDLDLDVQAPEGNLENNCEPVMETEVAVKQTETRSNCRNMAVNVEFQRRFLNIGSKPVHQSQAVVTANALAGPTQLPEPSKKRR